MNEEVELENTSLSPFCDWIIQLYCFCAAACLVFLTTEQ